jgi:hypothetical protein
MQAGRIKALRIFSDLEVNSIFHYVRQELHQELRSAKSGLISAKTIQYAVNRSIVNFVALQARSDMHLLPHAQD